MILEEPYPIEILIVNNQKVYTEFGVFYNYPHLKIRETYEKGVELTELVLSRYGSVKPFYAYTDDGKRLTWG